MVDFWRNVLSNVVSNGITYSLGVVFTVIVAYFNPTLFSYIIIMLAIIVICGIVLPSLSLGVVSFKWGHIYSYEKHRLLLQNDNRGVDTITFGTKINRRFIGKVTGEYAWDDISVTQVQLQANNANIKLECLSIDGSKDLYERDDRISISNDPISANYSISFLDDKPEEVKVDVSFEYDKEIMKEEYYVDVFRPMGKLVIELNVENGVKLHKVKRMVTAEYGDYSNYKSSPIKYKEMPGYKIYTFTIKKPKLFHRYKIEWIWIKDFEKEKQI